MSSAIKVGSGYVEVTPRLKAGSLEAFKNKLNRQMALAGGNAGRAMGAATATAMSRHMTTEYKKMGREVVTQARTAGSNFGTVFMRNFNRETKGKIVFADAATLRANNKAAGDAGQTVGNSYSSGFASAAQMGKRVGKDADDARKFAEGLARLENKLADERQKAFSKRLVSEAKEQKAHSQGLLKEIDTFYKEDAKRRDKADRDRQASHKRNEALRAQLKTSLGDVGKQAQKVLNEAHARHLTTHRAQMSNIQSAMDMRRKALRDNATQMAQLESHTRAVIRAADTAAAKAATVSNAINRSAGSTELILAKVEKGLGDVRKALTYTETTVHAGARAWVGLGNVSNAQLRQMSESVRQFSNRLQGFGQDWSLFITAPIAGSMVAVTAWGLQVGAELQKSQIGIQRLAEVAGHDLASATSLANAQLADLRQFAELSTFEFAPLANGVQRLMAAGIEAETATHWIKTLGDTSAAFGAGADEMNRAIIAISQSMAAGKIYAQDMNQLNNAGIPIWRMMAEATGESEAALREQGKAGELLSDEIWPELIKYMEQYEDTAKKMAEEVPLYAWQNALERFKNGLGDLINGTNEAMEVVNPERPAMWVKLFGEVEKTLVLLLPMIGSALDMIVPALTTGFEKLNGFLERISGSEDGVSGFGLALMGIAAFMGPAMMTIGFIGRGIASLISGLRLLPDNIESLNEVVGKLTEVGDGMLDMGNKSEKAEDKLEGVSKESKTLKERLSDVGDYFGSAAKEGWGKGTKLADDIGASMVKAADKIGEFGDKLRKVPDVVGSALLFAEDKVSQFTIAAALKVEEFSTKVVEGFTKGSGKVKEFWGEVRDGTAWAKMKQGLSEFEKTAKDRFNNALASFENFFQGADGGLARIVSGIKSIPSVVRIKYEEAGGIGGIAKSLGKGAANAAGTIGRGMASATRGAFGAIGALISLLSSVLGPVLDVMKNVLGSTLEALGKALEPLAEAFAGAILPALTAAVVALTPAILAFTPVMEMLGEALAPVIETLATEFADLMAEFAPIFSDLVAQLSPFLSELATFVVQMLGAIGPILGELLVALMPVVAMIAGAFMEALNFLLPIITQILEAISPLIPVIGEFLMEAIALIVPVVVDLFEALAPLVPILGEALMAAIETLAPIVFNLFDALSPLIPVLVSLLEAVMPIIQALMPLIELVGVLLGLLVSILAPIITLAATIVAWLIEKALVPLINWLAKAVEWIADKLSPKVEWLKDKLVDFTAVVQEKFGEFKEKWDEIWDGLGKKAKDVYDKWIKPVVDGVGKAWDKVTGLFSGDPDDEPVKKAKGGVIPGYAPGVDSVPALLSPGEGILRPEVVRKLGVSTINRWNKQAMDGSLARFATGGVVGQQTADTAAAAVLSGPVLSAPLPEVAKELEGLEDIYEASTGAIGDDWTRSAQKIISTTESSMSDVYKSTESSLDKVTAKSKRSLSTLSESIVRPSMRQSASHTQSGMRDMESATSRGFNSMNSTTTKGFTSINSTTTSRTRAFVSTVQKATRDANSHWSSMVNNMNRSSKGLVNTSYSKGIVGVLSQMSSLAGVGNPLKPVHLSTGGVLPGYQPGIDTIPAMLSAGEGVLRPEVVKALGEDTINKWNKSAMDGTLQKFANGGVVDGAAWVRKNKDKPYKGFADAFKGAMKEAVEPSLKSFAGLSGGYGSRGAEDIRSGYPGIQQWLGTVDKAANSGGNASKVVKILQQEHSLGVSGRPNKYGPAEAWCANFVSWVVDKAKANKAYWNSPKGAPASRWPGVATWEAVSSRAGDYRMGTSGIRPGDIVTYGGGGQHINMVEKVLGNGLFQTIGGNESDAVRRQTRSTARGYGRPRWPMSGGSAGSGPFKGVNVNAWPGSFDHQTATDGGGVEEFLAKGGIINSPTRAVIGEAGPEVVLPLSNRERTADLLEEIGLPHKSYNITINAAPNVPTEDSLLKALSYADTIYG